MCKSIVHCKFTIPNEWVLVNWSLVLSLKMYSKSLFNMFSVFFKELEVDILKKPEGE